MFKQFIKNTPFGISAILLFLAIGFLVLILPVFGHKTLIVRTGSMQPQIGVGDLIFVWPKSEYRVGDIIAFKEEGRSPTTITHRINSVINQNNQIFYETKGDANKQPDDVLVPKNYILGSADYSIKGLGKIFVLVKTKNGFLLTALIPAVLVIVLEVLNVIREFKKPKSTKTPVPATVLVINKKSNKHQGPMGMNVPSVSFRSLLNSLTEKINFHIPKPDIGMPYYSTGFKSILPYIVIVALLTGTTLASTYSDSEISTGNVFQAASVYPSSTPQVSEPFADDVIAVAGTFGHCCSDLSSDPLVAKPLVTGAPDSPPDTDFIQISDSSSVTLKFVDNKAVPAAGPDIRIHIYDTEFPAFADISVSQDCTTFTSLGLFEDDQTIDLEIESALYPFVKCVKLTDQVAGGDPFPTLGFDLDAVEALHSQIDP